MQVFILLFNARTDNEGIHTLKVNPARDGSDLSQDVVLAFESEDDATRYAILLEAQDFPTATVESIDRSEIEEFCQSAGLELQFIAEGTLEVPPEKNLAKTDWHADGKAAEPDSPQVPVNPELDRIRRQLEGLL